jgi:hypothetical protein
MPIEFWEEMVKRDLWISAEEAVILGLADRIILPKKRGNLRKVRIASMKQERDKKNMGRLIRLLKDRIYMDKLSRLELHLPEEKFDKSLTVDTTPVVDEVKASSSPQPEQLPVKPSSSENK